MATAGNIDATLVNSLNTPSAATKTKESTAGKNQIGQDQFLQLLITQLKNQDPLDPMKNDQFAVDMAQFTQVEQLMKINEALSKSSSGDMGSLATYLGKEVILKGDSISVAGGNGGNLRLSLAADSATTEVEILGSDGTVKATKSVGALAKGEHSVSLADLNLPDGTYGFRVKGTSAQGGAVTVKSEIAGIVSGFIPGADPKLLIGSKEIAPADIVRVSLPA
jgi:flagellar basal-body rod modification protein FlgD